MKMNKTGATFAILEIVSDMYAQQRAMNALLIAQMAQRDENEIASLGIDLNTLHQTELALIRARMLRFSEMDEDNLLKGLFDV